MSSKIEYYNYKKENSLLRHQLSDSRMKIKAQKSIILKYEEKMESLVQLDN